MEIPKQLQETSFRFVLLGEWNKWKNKETAEETTFPTEIYDELKKEKIWTPLGKAPFEKGWQKKGYKFNDNKFLEHIKTKNYGVIGGYGNLVIVDIDDVELAKSLEAEYDTFTIRTGGGGKHFYFICEDEITNKVLVEEKGEVRAKNYQVVCSPCKHPSGRNYEIHIDKPIKKASSKFILGLIKGYLRKDILNNEEKPKDTSRSGLEYRKVLALIKEGKEKEKIFQEMMAYSKWATSTPQYKELTYTKAKGFIEKELTEEEIKAILNDVYPKIIKILKDYCDMKEDYYPLVSLWVIGTYFHKQFPTYPYLYFNAMKGSGKTRILKLLSNISHNGKLITSLSEAVLFRTASQSTFCLDEFERVAGKEKQALRELLNASYKRGMSVERAKKFSFKGNEGYKIEKYDLYCPIALANIWGMEDVLGDRCISLTLEKSDNPTITRILELFEENEEIEDIKLTLGSVCSVLAFVLQKYNVWNSYVRAKNSTLNNKTLLSTNTTQHYKHYSFFDKIYDTGLNSRYLELFFPLFLLAELCGKMDVVIEIAQKIVKEKKDVDIDENRDVSLIDFVANKEVSGNFVSLKEILKEFREHYTDDEDEGKWINSKWLGRALKRLSLIKDKRKVRGCRETILDIEKAKRKILMFKTSEKEPSKEE